MTVRLGLEELLARKSVGGNGSVNFNWPAARLAEAALRRGEGTLAENGALVVRTGAFTGRSPEDKYIVSGPGTDGEVWWGSVNHPVAPLVFDQLLDRALAHLGQREVFVFDGYAGAAPSERLGLRVITEKAWHALFATTLFIRPSKAELARHAVDFTLINAGSLEAGGAAAGLRSQVFVGIDFSRRIALILGTEYAGEMKKAIFSVMNYVLPRKGILTMHCSANVGDDRDTALFFGLSGTGKTTLSADPRRALIGDDETAWYDGGVFNIEGGCYAKCINLSREAEPQIYDAIRFGSVLENVVVDQASRHIDYADSSITENTRATYPVEFIPGAAIPSVGPHPQTVIFLTADAFGVLPPIAKLTPDLAMYHYISGYTAKVAGTEAGVTEPKATFSPCFGGPFLPLHPMRYAKLLGERLSRHDASCWLVNTGWSGGPYGVGRRMKIAVSRAVVSAALSGALDSARLTPDPIFKFLIPETCEGVPGDLLQPRQTWADPAAYDAKARDLARLFKKNFEQYAAACAPEVRAAGPE
ncbi:MAG TPA: phosphoenolpyruvate carboxykinase (ATP) [Polyangia bacterium]|jgi:phosphoenolpyruvate carboxykinase (ATP)|nr:phosphoenolpyruvate carboxykinase (ATP) [Polyangia bacterium]